MVSGLIIAGVVAVGFLLLGLIFTKLYRKASKQMSFIRTGLGGEKIIMNGGAVLEWVWVVFNARKRLVTFFINTIRAKNLLHYTTCRFFRINS